jgi:hypothetical protein
MELNESLALHADGWAQRMLDRVGTYRFVATERSGSSRLGVTIR